MTNSVEGAEQIAPLLQDESFPRWEETYITPLFDNYGSIFGGDNHALVQVRVGHSFDYDGCADVEGTTLVSVPVGMASSPVLGVLLKAWVSNSVSGWTYLTSYNVTGVSCPVGGWAVDGDPF